jgi:ABC-type amino acid transport substrate-binding protein
MSLRHCNRRAVLLRGLALTGLASWQLTASANSLAQIQERGTLKVGIYNDMPPFHAGGRGIDVDLANALAEALNVKLTLLPFNADENMNDDLRNMVWKGHYLGYGPADVLLHVPVDAPLMNANPQVLIFAPYCRERVAIARNLERVPTLDSLAPLVGQPVAVPGQSLAGWLLIGSESGLLRDSLRTQWKDGTEAARALLSGNVVAAGGMLSELESVLQGDERFAISPLPVPRAPRDGWAVGLAVKRDATELAEALTRSLNTLAQSGRMQQIFAAQHVQWSMA